MLFDFLDGGAQSESTVRENRAAFDGYRLFASGPVDVHNRSTATNVLTPGKTWIRVRSAAFTVEALMAAILRGDFYASNGVDLLDVRRDARGLSIDIEDQDFAWPENAASYRTTFIGPNGRILPEVYGASPAYRFKGDEGYVRATVTDSNGRKAWTQPIFIEAKSAAPR